MGFIDLLINGWQALIKFLHSFIWKQRDPVTTVDGNQAPAQLRQTHLYMVAIAGGAGVLIATVIFRSCCRSMREMQQPFSCERQGACCCPFPQPFAACLLPHS